MKKIILLTALTLTSAYAQDNLAPIEVTHERNYNSLVDFVPSVKKLEKKELQKRREATLGDTLRSEAGVQSSSFGPNAGRPIIRGLEGDRIRVLQNGLGVLDASSQSVDHAVPVDTLIMDSVEVVRGPMSLLYGSSAVGGVVNVNTTRIHSSFEEGSVQEVLVQGDSSQNALTTGAKIDFGKNNWMLHFDGSYRNANNLVIPGKARSKKLRDLDPQADEEEDKLPNSGSVQKTMALGLSRIFNKGYVGLSYYFFDNYYGTVAEEEVKIKMKQNRLEFHGEYRLDDKNLRIIRLKSAQSDYSHKELEAGEVGTTFANEGNESRLELVTKFAGLEGITGVQSQIFNFSAVGEEAYLPPSQNRIISLFTLQDYKLGKNTFTAGARLETFNVEDVSNQGKEKNFNGLNGSLGHRFQFTDSFSSSVSLSYTERAPNFQELFADGAHLATGTFEQGNDGLKKEKAYAIDLGVRYKNQDADAGINIFTQKFQDYITLFDSGVTDTDSGFNIYDYDQVDAIFYGIEADAKHRIGKSNWSVFTRGDLVRAKNSDDGKNLPRISPPRISAGLEFTKSRWSYDLEAQYNFEQTKTAPNELRTEAFTLLNVGFNYDLISEQGRLSFFGRLKNLLNQEARLHTSTLKDVAPLAGRSVVAGVQTLF